MSALRSGDIVKDGPRSTTRVVVNQHRSAELISDLLTLESAAGVRPLSLTADHVLEVSGKMVAAREALVAGARLGTAEGTAVVTRASHSTGAVINPITASGKIIANGVVAATYPEWIAEWMFTSYVPLPLSLGNALSALFPEHTQAYYDDALEPFFAATAPRLVALKRVLPSPLVVLAFLVADVGVSAGFMGYALLNLKVAMLVLAAAALAAAKAHKASTPARA